MTWLSWLKDILPSARPRGPLVPTEPPRERPRRWGLRRRNPERYAERHATAFGPCSRLARLTYCVVPSCRVAWPQKLEAAHVRSRGAGGADAGNVVGLCHLHHLWLHQHGIRSFEKRHQVSLEVAASRIAEEVAKHLCAEWPEATEAGLVRCAVCLAPTEEPKAP